MKEVIVRQEQVTIPTYPIAAYDKNPMFLEKRVYHILCNRYETKKKGYVI